jgi:plasmid stability protein
MATLTIRGIPDSLKKALRLRAAKHGRSMEEEARQLLRQAMTAERAAANLGSRIAARFGEVGGVNLPALRRTLPRTPDLARERVRR